MKSFSRLFYRGQPPGADTKVYTLFDSTVLFPAANMVQQAGLLRFVAEVAHTNNGALRLFRSEDRGVRWQQVEQLEAPGTDGQSQVDWDIEPYSDIRVDWKNGGFAQTAWTVVMNLLPRLPTIIMVPGEADWVNEDDEPWVDENGDPWEDELP